MAVPRKKVSRMKTGNRQSPAGLTRPAYVEDKDSGERRRPHHIDLNLNVSTEGIQAALDADKSSVVYTR